MVRGIRNSSKSGNFDMLCQTLKNFSFKSSSLWYTFTALGDLPSKLLSFATGIVMFHCSVLQPNNAGQWGDNANQQWSTTVGKSRPNPQQNPANWGGVDDLNWNTPPVCTDIVSFLFVYMFLLLATTLHWICFEKNLFLCVIDGEGTSRKSF